MGGVSAQTFFTVAGKSTSAHFIGGNTIGEDAGHGVVDAYQRVFGCPGLHVMDGSVITANPGVNPSLTITAMAERAMALWPNKGEADKRPEPGAGYVRIDPIPPNAPVVPVGALGELRGPVDLGMPGIARHAAGVE